MKPKRQVSDGGGPSPDASPIGDRPRRLKRFVGRFALPISPLAGGVGLIIHSGIVTVIGMAIVLIVIGLLFTLIALILIFPEPEQQLEALSILVRYPKRQAEVRANEDACTGTWTPDHARHIGSRSGPDAGPCDRRLNVHADEIRDSTSMPTRSAACGSKMCGEVCAAERVLERHGADVATHWATQTEDGPNHIEGLDR